MILFLRYEITQIKNKLKKTCLFFKTYFLYLYFSKKKKGFIRKSFLAAKVLSIMI